MGGGTSFLISQLSTQGPIVLVYLVAICLAFNYIDRARLPSILTIIGVVISIVTTILVIAAHTYIISNRSTGSEIGTLMMFVSVAGSVLRAVGLGFFVAAIFVGRNHVAPADRYLHE